MNKKKILFSVGVILIIVSLALIAVYILKTRTIEFTCNSNCTANEGLEYVVKLDKLSKDLTITKKNGNYFTPSLPIYSNSFTDGKYDKLFETAKVKLTNHELKNVKKLYDLNKNTLFKNGSAFITILINLAYDDANYCKDDTSCYDAYKKFDSDNNQIITYREVANSMFEDYIKYYEENDNISPNSRNISFAEFKCQEKDDESCTKVVNVKYGHRLHEIRIKYYYQLISADSEETASVKYDFYIDDKKIGSGNVIDYFIVNENTNYVADKAYTNRYDLKNILNFGGNLLVFDNNLGFAKQIFITTEKGLTKLDIFNNSKKVASDINLSYSFSDSEVKVDGKHLIYSYPICGETKMIDLEFKIDNGKLKMVEKDSRDMNEDQTISVKENDYCYNKNTKKIEEQTKKEVTNE